MNIYKEIEKLIQFSIKNNLIDEIDEILVRNKVLEVLDIDDYEIFPKEEILKEIKDIIFPTEILDNITNWAGENGKLKENILVFKDLLNSKIMGQIIPRTSHITRVFWEKYKNNKEDATKYFYDLSQKSNYIRTDRIKKNINYKYTSEYGDLEITINLSKPEKDPKEIELAKLLPPPKYPQSLLCKENEGYMGRINHPGRQNHRIIKLNLTNEDWFFQYSPYIYYNEHSIVFSSEMRPMKIDKGTFERLIEFVEIFPHYFIGSNADLPIVGGSILSHDHFQAGNHTFAMDKATIKEEIKFEKYNKINAGILNWPLSVIRLNTNIENKKELIELSDLILNKWINYSDEENEILAFTNGVRHNTITPIARRIGNNIELDLVLRNNRTTEEFPLGIFHPHSKHHSIKKENIGLIEVMGLAVLPGRLKEEMEKLKILLNNETSIENVLHKMEQDKDLTKHLNWVKDNFNMNTNISEAIGKTFSKVLEDCGVFKQTEAGKKGFIKFINTI